jgi:hypothetical protein
VAVGRTSVQCTIEAEEGGWSENAQRCVAVLAYHHTSACSEITVGATMGQLQAVRRRSPRLMPTRHASVTRRRRRRNLGHTVMHTCIQ